MKSLNTFFFITILFSFNSLSAQKDTSATENTLKTEFAIPTIPSLSADTAFENSFIDEFISPGKWAEEDNVNSVLKRKDGFYLFENRKNILYSSAMSVSINTKKNFATECKIQHLSGENYYGMLIGGEETDGTLFMINPQTKSYWILYNNELGSTDYFKQENSEIVSKDINILRTEKIGFKQRFFLNNTYIGEVPFVNFMGNKHGFIIDGRGMFSVDYFKLQWGD